MAILETVPGITYDQLFGGPETEVLTKNITIASGAGKLLRGALLGVLTAGGKAKAVTKGATDGTQIANCILAEDVDATSADTVATVYISGRFNREAILVRSGDTAAAHAEELRNGGIYLTSLHYIKQ